MSSIVPVAKLTLPKTRQDWQVVIHALAMAGVPLLVGLQLARPDTAAAWVAIILAAIDPIISFVASPDAVRKVIYGLGGLVQSVLVWLGVFTEQVAAGKIGSVVTFLIALVAIFYTSTSGLKVAGNVSPQTNV